MTYLFYWLAPSPTKSQGALTSARYSGLEKSAAILEGSTQAHPCHNNCPVARSLGRPLALPPTCLPWIESIEASSLQNNGQNKLTRANL